ncbi:MAG: amidophosphoribosyltransferase [Desulfobacterota bacterium]|nr:amidophosphoribosyltransferase [Thermodesulfobacteriota bacterium]
MSGMFGVVAKDDCVATLYYGIDYHSHLGTEFAGMAVLGDGFMRCIHNISQSQFKAKFADEYKKLKGTMGIGVISAIDEQPVYQNTRFGQFCITTDGFIENSATLARELMEHGITFSEVSRKGFNLTELVAKLIIQGKDVVDGICRMHKRIEGSTSLLLLCNDGIYAARDLYGYTQLVVGRRGDDWAVANETIAFVNSDFAVVKYLDPGEIVLISHQGMKQVRPPQVRRQTCAFMWIYTGFPASNYDGINIEIVRERCGAFLARRDHDIRADVVCGVPDSGTSHAIGYAMASGIPFRRPLVKYNPGYGRSYTPPSQETRDLVAKMKLIPIKEIINGQSIVVCDDSLVRGTQLKNFTIKKLIDNGAKAIHVRLACPPLMFPCKFIYSTRDINELAARRAIAKIEGRNIEDVQAYIDHTTPQYQKMVDVIAQELGVTSLRYQTVDDMVAAIGLPKESLCMYCWTGVYPPRT